MCAQLALLPLKGLGSQAAAILASISAGDAAYVAVLRLLLQPAQLAALLTLAARCLPGVPCRRPCAAWRAAAEAT